MILHTQLDHLWRALHFAASEITMLSSYQDHTRTWDRTRPHFCVVCNDMYMWGGSDAESITLDDIPRLVQLTRIDASWAPYLLTGHKRGSFEVQPAIARLASWQSAKTRAEEVLSLPAPDLDILPEISILSAEEAQERWATGQALLPLLLGGWNVCMETCLDDATPVPLGVRVFCFQNTSGPDVVQEDIWHRVEWDDVPGLIEAHRRAGIMGALVWAARRIDPGNPERLFAQLDNTELARASDLNMSPKDAMDLLDNSD